MSKDNPKSEEELNQMEEALKKAGCCPFCGSLKLDISDKSIGHIAVFCKSCYSYGPRVLTHCVRDPVERYTYHWFKTKKDANTNTDGLFFKKTDDSEIPYNWYYGKAVELWNDRQIKLVLTRRGVENGNNS